jgi:hypothetical protein
MVISHAKKYLLLRLGSRNPTKKSSKTLRIIKSGRNLDILGPVHIRHWQRSERERSERACHEVSSWENI